jgi:CheY-like chemotaxis protein
MGERAPVHVEKVAREAVDLLRARLPANVVLESRLEAGHAAVSGDAVQIHRLLMNLGTNALHAMSDGGVLAVSLNVAHVGEPRPVKVRTVEPGEWIVLKVADQGSGILPGDMERIFDPFFTTKQSGVGSGLGLTLVLRIVIEAEGAIDVQSEPGVGSVFTVYLPRAGDAPLVPEHRPATAPRGHGQRVMVVDDEPPLLELTTDALRGLGYEPVGFVSPQEAIDAFRRNAHDFDALVTDLRMPRMSGEALIREVRRIQPLLPAILVSGFVGDAAAQHAQGGRADDILTKPLRTDSLAVSLARLLGNRVD